MRLVSIINVWFDAIDLLPYCLQNQAECGVDGIIIIWSEASNHGEVKMDYLWPAIHPKSEASLIPIHIFQREPQFRDPRNSETDKRNFGLERARELGYTHFLTIDQDEMYDPIKFKKQKERFKNEPYLQGIVCPSNVYFKSPTLTVGRDVTLVPFIHQISARVKHEFNKRYPFAFDNKGIRIDPTRQLSLTNGIQYTEDIVMEHYSYCRKDIELKIRNSTARTNIERSTIREDYKNAAPGVYCEFYKAVIQPCENIFNLPEFGQS